MPLLKIMEAVMQISNRKKFFTNLFVAVLVVLTAGCQPQSTIKKQKDVRTASESLASAQIVNVLSVNISPDGDSVLIDTDGQVRYTAFQLNNPPRLVIDLPSVNILDSEQRIELDGNFISKMVVSSYIEGTSTNGRVEIGLQPAINYDVKAGENSIVVKLTREVFISGFAGEVGLDDDGEEDIAEIALMDNDDDESDLLAIDDDFDEESIQDSIAEIDFSGDMTDEEMAALEAEDTEEELASREPIDPNVASALVDIESYMEDTDTIIKIVGDGGIGNYSTFGLDGPTRLVIDLNGVAKDFSDKQYIVQGNIISKVRIGGEDGKVRVVFDVDDSSMPVYDIYKEGKTLTVKFEGGETGLPVSAVPYIPQYDEEIASIDEEEIDIFIEEDEEEIEIFAEEEEVFVEEEIMEDDFIVEDDMSDVASVDEVEEYIIDDIDYDDEVVVVGDSPMIKSVKVVKGIKNIKVDIIATEYVDYLVNESIDGRTLILDFDNITIPDKLKVTQDATELNTPIESVSSYQKSMKPDKHVRVLVKFNRDADYEIYDDKRKGIVSIQVPLKSKKSSAADTIYEPLGSKTEALFSDTGPLKKYRGKKIDMDMSNAQITDVIGLLAEVADLNIITSDDVKGTITLRLKNVEWDKALDYILRTQKLTMLQDGNIVRVMSNARLQAEEADAIKNRLAKQELGELVTEYIRISYDSATELTGQVNNLLTDRGSVSAHDGTNTLIVRDVPEGIAAVKDYIANIDIPTPQVLIEARIVEAEQTFARDLGISWNGTYDTLTADGYSNTTGGVTLDAAGSAGGLGSMNFLFGKTSGNPLILDLTLSAGEQEGKLKTIARPKIITLDNTEARIEQGDSIPISTGGSGSVSTTFVDANLNLTVTPHITPDGSILMKIKASKNSLSAFRSATGEPGINKKEANTELLVKDGETTVIGGIVETTVSTNISGIPFLKDIPLIGWMFKNKSVLDTQKELLIFITPRIVKDPSTPIF